MRYLKLFENFENQEITIPQEIIDKLESTEDSRILDTLEDLKKELNGDRDESKLHAYVDDIGVCLDDTSMTSKEADDIYFALQNIVIEHSRDISDEEIVDEEDELLDTKSEKVNLSIELEKKLRNLDDDSSLTVDDFLSEFGVNPGDMTNFAYASILKNKQPYEDMSDEEFNRVYDEYKSSLNESIKSDPMRIDNVVDFINPCDPMDSSEYGYYCFGDDEAYYGGLSLNTYMDAIEQSVFHEESNTSKKFGWDFLQYSKQQILDRCRELLLSSSIDFASNANESKDSGVTASLKKKSKASGIPVGILRKVFSKGMQAWNAGHRPGVAQHQWGLGRVNSFITGAGGARKADADLWAKAKESKARKNKNK